MEVTSYAPGTFTWVELATTDSAAAKKFYTELFGWTADDAPMGPDEVYTTLQKNGKSAGAMYSQNAEQRSQGVPPNWMSYISVESADETAEKAKSLGGNVILAPFDVMEFGRMAVLSDPQGAVFSLWQPKTHHGAQVVNEPGSFCWNELGTSDMDGGKAFYSGLFGWGAESYDYGMPYVMFQNGDRPAGGMYPVDAVAPGIPPNWLVYFAVEDADATAAKIKELGGNVMKGPDDIPNIGRFAIATDPQGAAFAIIKLEMPPA